MRDPKTLSNYEFKKVQFQRLFTFCSLSESHLHLTSALFAQNFVWL